MTNSKDLDCKRLLMAFFKWQQVGFALNHYISGLSSLGVSGVPGHTRILANQLTLSQPGGRIMPTKLYLVLNFCRNKVAGTWLSPSSTLISLINVESRQLILKKKIHPPHTFPPSTFIDFLDFFHPPLHVYCIYVLVFFQKSHPPCLFQPPRLLI